MINASMVASIPLLPVTSRLNRGQHTVKPEQGKTFQAKNFSQVFPGTLPAPLTIPAIKNPHLRVPGPTLVLQLLAEDISGFALINFFGYIFSFSEGELLEPGQGGPLPGLPIPQGVGPSTSAGHIQVT